MEQLKDFYTVAELAPILGIMPAAVRYNIRKGYIKALKMNGGYIVQKEEVKRLLEERAKQ